MQRNFKTLVGEKAADAAAILLRELHSTYNVTAAIAYGSRVRGDNHQESDLDVAIILKGPRLNKWDVALDMADSAYDVMLKTGIYVSPLPLWANDLTHPESFSNPALIKNITSEGIRIFSCSASKTAHPCVR
jgi:predicted nucleotidyltransferase